VRSSHGWRRLAHIAAIGGIPIQSNAPVSESKLATPHDETLSRAIAPSSRYRELGVLGEGGMGVVYKVHDTHDDRVLALKRMAVATPDGANEARAQATARFRREYHTLAELAHPNIIEVYDFGIDEAGPYYTMEFLEGSDVREAAPMRWQEVCALLRDVAAALALLHSRRLLHRDISPRNVCRTRAGRAKLIDFGALSPMGVERVLAGTPPFIPPECVARQSLDGRTDIYGLGALAYFLLTGRHAYPARTIGQLRDLWRGEPRLPSAFAHDVPESLDALVMRMLSLDPQGRPGLAVELVERLTALAGLDLDDVRYATAVRAYLTAPALVGRRSALLGVRRRTLRALRNHGASIFVTGVAGIGRSRFLDACALEAKLAGAIVLRVSRADSGSDFAAARALFEQLPGQLSDAELANLPSAALARSKSWPIHAPGRASLPPVIDLASSERGPIQAELFAYLTALASRRLLAILADDLEDIDEPSLALLASLAQVVREHRLVLVGASVTGVAPRVPAYRALAAASRTLPLAPLEEAEVEELLRSVFGEIPNLTVLASRIYGLSAGLPRLCMELSQHLLDRGVIQSRAGGFTLQESFSIADLPASFRDALRLRVAALAEPARLFGATLALAGSALLSLDTCIELDEHADATRVYHAISDLQRLQIVSLEAEGVRLAKGYDDTFIAQATPAQLARIHARLAPRFARETSDCVRAAKHYFAAGQEQVAINMLLRYAQDEPSIRFWYSENRGVLEQGIAACQRLGRPTRDVFFLRRTLTRALTFYIEPADREQLLDFANELYDLAGARFFPSDETDPLRRLEIAVKLAFEHHEKLSEQERVLTPFEALEMLGSYIAGLAAYATYTLDIELLRRVPSLMPFAPLSPSLVFMERIVFAMSEIRSDRTHTGIAVLLENIGALESPEGAGFVPGIREATRAHVLSGVGILEASLGRFSALERARLVEEFPDHRVNAWRIRYIFHLYVPNAQKAEECRREIERLRLQEGSRQFGEGSTLETELLAFSRSDDLLGLARIKPQIAERAALYPGWLPWLRVAEAQFERMRHRLDRAIELHAQALALTAPGKHLAWTHTAAFQLEVLVQAGRAAEAKALGEVWLAVAKQHVEQTSDLIELGLALAEAALGNLEVARSHVEHAMAQLEFSGVAGIYGGIYHEVAARVAVDCDDAAAFSEEYKLCWEQYGSGAYPPLAARLEKLMTAARRRKLANTGGELATANGITAERVRSELAAAATRSERVALAVSLLVEAAHASAGHLYGIRGADIELLASRGAVAPSAELESMLRGFVRAHSDDERTLGFDQLSNRQSTLQVSALDSGRYYLPVLLSSGHGARTSVVAVVALAFAEGVASRLTPEVAAAVGDELLAASDVTGLTLAL
jgi:hypothetical protein